MIKVSRIFDDDRPYAFCVDEDGGTVLIRNNTFINPKEFDNLRVGDKLSGVIVQTPKGKMLTLAEVC